MHIYIYTYACIVLFWVDTDGSNHNSNNNDDNIFCRVWMLQVILNTLRLKKWPLHVAIIKILEDTDAQKHDKDDTLENMDALNTCKHNTLKTMIV